MKEVIPKGIYCYTRDQSGKRVYCPHFQITKIGGYDMPYCAHLKQAGLSNTPDDDKLFYEHFNEDIDKMMEAMPLDLLFDAVKECGENDDIEEWIGEG